MKNPPAVLGFGTAVLDLLANVDDSFIQEHSCGGKGGMVLIDDAACSDMLSKLPEYVVAPGGSAGNTLAGLLHLGVNCRMLGKVGRDPQGDIYRERFAKLGGDLSAFKFSEKTPTGCCICLVTPDSERTMRTFLGAASEITGADFSPEDLDGIDLLHLEGYQLYSPGMFETLLSEAKKRGIPVSFDFSSYEIVRTFHDRIRSLLKDIDIVFANEEEAAAFAEKEESSPEEILKELSACCNTAVVKLGKKGALLSRNGEILRVQAELVPAVDTTGAGDLWQAGFLYGHLMGKDLETCGKMGAVLGAEVVQVLGASIPGDRWQMITEKFNQI